MIPSAKKSTTHTVWLDSHVRVVYRSERRAARDEVWLAHAMSPREAT